jgi:hypothetical protein
MATTVTIKPNAIDLSGSTSGTTTLQATAVAGTTTITLPAATDTLVGKATTDTLTNKTLTGAVMNGTVGATTPSTGAFTTLSATGSIAPVATPSTSWGIDFGASTSVPNYSTLGAAATYDLAAGSGIVVIHNNGNGDGAVLFTYGGFVVKLGGAASVVTGVGGASQIGLVYDSGAGKYRINNGYATSQSIFITTIRTRTGS